MKTIDDALASADMFDKPANKYMSIVMLAAEVRRLREENEQLANAMTQCYRMLLSEPDTQGALFKAENILRESLAGRGTK